MEEKIKIICALRSGGDYTLEYVQNMKNSLDRVIGYRDDWEFICRTDTPFSGAGIICRPLVGIMEGWWSKIEIFCYTGPCLYFDLDTVLVSDFSHLFDIIHKLKKYEFLALKPFRSSEVWASGIMAWNGNWNKVFNDDYIMLHVMGGDMADHHRRVVAAALFGDLINASTEFKEWYMK